MKLSEKLKLLREKNKMTQKEIAQKINVSERVYSYYEQDRFPKDEEILKKLAEALNTTVSNLIDEKNEVHDKLIIIARKSKTLSPEDRDKLFKVFDETLDIFLNKENDED